MIDTFTHNDHNGYVQFSTNLTEKRLSYQNGMLFFYQPSTSSGTFAIFQHSYVVWNLFLEDGNLCSKIAAIILYIRSTLGSIFSKWHLTLYAGERDCTCAIFGVKYAIHLSKLVRYLYQWYLSHKQRSVVRLKQTTVICNIRQIEFESL